MLSVTQAKYNLEGASLEALAFVDCSLIPGIAANGCVIRHDLLIDRTTIKGELRSLASMRQTAAIWLCEAKLGGRLLVRNYAIIDGGDGRSIQADRINIGANIRILNGSEIRGELRLISARVAGSLDIVSSSMIATDVAAVELAESKFGGSVFLAKTTADAPPTVIDGLLSMSDVTVGAALVFVSLLLASVPIRPVFWAAFAVNLVSCSACLVHGFQMGMYTFFGLGILMILPLAAFWAFSQLAVLNSLRQSFPPARPDRGRMPRRPLRVE